MYSYHFAMLTRHPPGEREYRFSSARFYETGEDEFKILTHYMDKL